MRQISPFNVDATTNSNQMTLVLPLMIEAAIATTSLLLFVINSRIDPNGIFLGLACGRAKPTFLEGRFPGLRVLGMIDHREETGVFLLTG